MHNLYMIEKSQFFWSTVSVQTHLWATICHFAPLIDFLHIATTYFPWRKNQDHHSRIPLS